MPKAPGGAEFVPELIHNRSGVGSHIVAADLNKDGNASTLLRRRAGDRKSFGAGGISRCPALTQLRRIATRVRCEKAAEARPIVHGRFGAGHRGRVASRDAACVAILVLTVAGWVNRHQEDLIDFLREENRILREERGRRPLRLTDAQRRRLAVRGKRLGRRAWMQVAGIVTPDTILRWSGG